MSGIVANSVQVRLEKAIIMSLLVVNLVCLVFIIEVLGVELRKRFLKVILIGTISKKADKVRSRCWGNVSIRLRFIDCVLNLGNMTLIAKGTNLKQHPNSSSTYTDVRETHLPNHMQRH